MGIIRSSGLFIIYSYFTPLRIENAQSASSSSLITAPEGAPETSYCDEIYEDLYIGKILHMNNVFPKHIPDFYKYISSPEHSRMTP